MFLVSINRHNVHTRAITKVLQSLQANIFPTNTTINELMNRLKYITVDIVSKTVNIKPIISMCISKKYLPKHTSQQARIKKKTNE
jgi:hypothetical protein